MPRDSPLPHPLSLGPFRYEQAAIAGVSRSRLRASDILHPHHGLYVPWQGDADLVTRCEHLVPLLGEQHWFSHLTAARLWGMPVPTRWSPGEPLRVMALADAAPMRRAEVIGWETEGDLPRTMLGALPLVAPADVWCQLAVRGSIGVDAETGWKRNLDRDWLVAVGDFLLTGPKLGAARRPLCTLDELTEAVARRRGRRGVKDLAWAVEHVRAPVHSPKETFTRLGLVACGLPEPEVQVPVLTAEGWRHSDLGYPEARLLIEYQGDHHRTDRAQWLSDLTRVQLFEDAGYRVMLVGDADITPDCRALAARIRRALG